MWSCGSIDDLSEEIGFNLHFVVKWLLVCINCERWRHKMLLTDTFTEYIISYVVLTPFGGLYSVNIDFSCVH